MAGVGFGRSAGAPVGCWPLPQSPRPELYDTLHRLDDLGLDFLLVITPADDEPGWLAVLDRVRRATRLWSERATGT